MKNIVKKFLEWIKIKEFLHETKKSPSFEEREVWWANIGENVGHEENGKGGQFTRPFVVIRKFNRELLFGVPCSSTFKENKYYCKFNTDTSNFRTSALLSQARSISSKRLIRKIDKMGSGSFREIKIALEKAILK